MPPLAWVLVNAFFVAAFGVAAGFAFWIADQTNMFWVTIVCFNIVIPFLVAFSNHVGLGLLLFVPGADGVLLRPSSFSPSQALSSASLPGRRWACNSA